MILTITLNPSMDYVYHTDTFSLGEHNRLDNPTRMPGGKGINCARALSSTETETMAYTVLGGKNGAIIHDYLEEENFTLQYLNISEESRNAITIMHDDKIQTEIVENGPKITEDMKMDIFHQIETILTENTDIDIVTINGSVNSDDLFFYNKLLTHIKEATDRDLKILMDLSKDALINVYQSQDDFPDFIKPNEKEFGELIGKKVETKAEILEYLKTHETKIPYILVSCGASGALAKFNGKIFDISIPTIDVVNPTGSGDSTVAGVAHALDNNLSEDDMLRMAMAFGMANAAEDGVGVVRKSNIDRFFKEVMIKEL